MKYLKNISTRYTIAVKTLKGIVNVPCGGQIPMTELVDKNEVSLLLKRVPPIVTMVEDTPAPKAPVVNEVAPATEKVEGKEEPIATLDAQAAPFKAKSKKKNKR